MPHFLCFTDLSLAGSSLSAIDTESSASTQTADVVTPEDEKRGSNQCPTTWFAREENKKSSFVLQKPYALFAESVHKPSTDVSVPQPASAAADVNGNASVAEENDQKVHQSCDNSDVEVEGSSAGEKDQGDLGDASLNAGEKSSSLFANASITSCISENASSNDSPKLTPGTNEMFLFGGFELITNVKTVEVYVIRPDDAQSRAPNNKITGARDETYLTTCKGIPARDLPPLATAACYVNGISPEGESKKCTTNSEEQNAYYKFIFVSPGGPKPAGRVRLKFVRSKDLSTDGTIIVRTLKVKGRLSDSLPTNKSQQQQPMQQPSMPIGATNFNQGMQNNKKNDNMGSLASMMAMMGGHGAMGMPMATQMNGQQQQLGQMQMMQSTSQQYLQQQQQQQSNHQQEKNQAELISSIAGLGLYMKSSEERTAKKFDTMLTNLEERIMKRLDNLAERLDAIEKRVDGSNDE